MEPPASGLVRDPAGNLDQGAAHGRGAGLAQGFGREAGGGEVSVPRYRETLPNGVTYDTLDITPNGISDDTREFVVPPGHFFMMGDNRDNSNDSRMSVGFVPLENFIGKANIIFFSIAGGASPLEIWRWPAEMRTDRILDRIR